MLTSKPSFMLLIFATVFNVAFLSCYATESPAEIYWKTKVGNIPMPKTLKISLQQGSSDEILNINPNYKLPTIDEHPAVDDCIFFWGKEVNYSQVGQALYFTTDKTFREGSKMNLHFKKIDNEAKFLPLKVAKSMPVESDKLQVVLNLLAVNPKSTLAHQIEITMKKCEEEGYK